MINLHTFSIYIFYNNHDTLNLKKRVYFIKQSRFFFNVIFKKTFATAKKQSYNFDIINNLGKFSKTGSIV